MQQPMDLAELRARYDDVRRSEYFPAILGAVAGGLTGALMAGLISGSRRGGEKVVRVQETNGEQARMILGLSPRDIIQLVTVVTSLARQVQDWRKET